ncbi:MAG: hypothetical protein J0L93_08630 [Deltaproteobacteria bacterium]|nr:hypothetical protein [Deltaproteobacteria bacterium]
MALYFVTGKGGVGKTRYSVLLSQKMKKAELAELSQALQSEAEKFKLSLSTIHSFSKETLGETFLKKSLRIPFLSHWISQSKIFQTLFQLAPNLYELLLLRQWIQIAENKDLIVDAPSSGHFIALLEAAKAAKEMFDGGSLHKLADEILKYFQKANTTSVFIVSLPETSALEESTAIEENLRKNYPKMRIQKILNRKHIAPPKELELSKNMQQLAYDRPKLEDERIFSYTFDQILEEGAVTL